MRGKSKKANTSSRVRIKDSGKRRSFATGSVRDARFGKGRYDLLPAMAIFLVARQFEDGAIKYAARNWEKGQPLSVYIDSAMRHGFNVLAGKCDENHAVAAAWNWLAFLETRYRIEIGMLPAELNDLPEPSHAQAAAEGRMPKRPSKHSRAPSAKRKEARDDRRRKGTRVPSGSRGVRNNRVRSKRAA